MNERKRQGDITLDDCNDNQTRKLQRIASDLTTTISTNRTSITHLEDLSNDLVYEIFDFFDTYYLYETFFNLNTRFRTLCTHSNLSININHSSLSKSSFEQYYTDFIVSNKHRIRSLHLSNPFIIDLLSSPNQDFSHCSRLQSLILGDIGSQHLEDLLQSLASLPHLSSLAISINLDTNRDIIFNLIIQLSSLKSCKITMERALCFVSISKFTDITSPVEHLILDAICDRTGLDAVLFFFPQVRRLSIKSMYERDKPNKNVLTTVVNNLTHVSLKLTNLSFDEFEPMIKQYFSKVKILQLTSESEATLLDADRWEQLILLHMPCLHIFDFQQRYRLFGCYYDESTCKSLYEKFTSLFWIKRQWFFEYMHYPRIPCYGIFYSTLPYRRKYFTIITDANSNKNTCPEKTVFNSVHHLITENINLISPNSTYFLNAYELTITRSHNNLSMLLPSDNFNGMISLTQLTKIDISSVDFQFNGMINMLRFTPNVQTLKFKSDRLFANELLPIQQSESFHLVSNQNKIKNLTITGYYTRETLRVLMKLCSELRYVTVTKNRQSVDATLEILSLKNEETTCHVCSLCFLEVDAKSIERWKKRIESKKLSIDYSFKVIDNTLHFWW